ncbi:MAG: BamA/TamA family outer membrane protein, partial [Bdellovibrionales bacterium]
EIAVGTSLRNSGLSQNLAGRVSHQNVFGTGKIVDLEVGGRIPLDEPTQRDFSTRLRYIDPKLFGSQKYFLVGGIFFQDSLYESKDGDSYSTEQLGVDLSLGRRIWDFSYVMAGYQHRPISEITDHIVGPDWAIETRSDAHERVYHLGYGWNSEDDAYFPTRGSRFNTTLTWSSSDHHSVLFKTGLAYRTTWSTAKGTVWTFQFGGTPRTEYRPSLDEDLAVSLAYARPLAASDALGGIERGRWYIEPGFYSLGYSSYQGVAADAGLKAGVRLESQSLGIIDLYAIATSDLSIGGDR